MPLFAKLGKFERKRMFKDLKSKIDTSWKKFYLREGISKSSFFNYLSGRGYIPLEIYKRWNRIIAKASYGFQLIKRPRYEEGKPYEYIMDKEMAEILGIINGDGHISKYKYEVCVVGSIFERQYYNYLRRLFKRKFGVSFKLLKDGNRFKLRAYSKRISLYLTEEFGLPKGNKIGRLKIPKKVFQSKDYLVSYLRGIFDTDGCFYLRRKNNAMITITSADIYYLKDIQRALEILGFNVSLSEEKVILYGKEKALRFFEFIKPANSKHLKRYNKYVRYARLV